MPSDVSKHCLCVRRSTEEKSGELQAIRDAIASPGVKGVCLYFHGGLSGESYVKNELAPELMDTFYIKRGLYDPQTNSGIYPIFVIYDADIRNEDTLKEWMRRLTNELLIGSLLKRFKRWVDEKNQFSLIGNATDSQVLWSQLLFGHAFTEMDSDSTRVRAGNLLTGSDGGSEELDEIAKNWIEEDPELADEHPNSGLDQSLTPPSLLPTFHIVKVAIRLAARFAIGSNHEVGPTIVEECIREIPYLKDLGPAHWHTVYEHATESWEKGRQGAELMAVLGEIKAKNPSFILTAQSHSAGSIVIAELIRASAKNKWPVLDRVVLVAPALSQIHYSETFLAYPQQYKRQSIFILSEEDEKGDNLVKNVYCASLLYFVSGIAEDAGFGDKMLLIAQHLQPNSTPYSKKWYREKLQRMGDSPDAAEKIWGLSKEIIKECPEKGSTHASTKFPQLTPGLADMVFTALTGGS